MKENPRSPLPHKWPWRSFSAFSGLAPVCRSAKACVRVSLGLHFDPLYHGPLRQLDLRLPTPRHPANPLPRRRQRPAPYRTASTPPRRPAPCLATGRRQPCTNCSKLTDRQAGARRINLRQRQPNRANRHGWKACSSNGHRATPERPGNWNRLPSSRHWTSRYLDGSIVPIRATRCWSLPAKACDAPQVATSMGMTIWRPSSSTAHAREEAQVKCFR